jgi:curli biogenesis system outer membrane secretion channel CsgG
MRPLFPLAGVVALALAAGSPTSPALAADAWRAYLESGQGESKELGNPKELGDKAWLSVRYTEYSGYRPRIGVVVIEDKGAYPPAFKNQFAKMIVGLSGKNNALPQNHLEDLVREALRETHRFALLERTSAIGDLAAEQALADSGRVDSATPLATGGILGAEYAVKTTLIELTPETQGEEVTTAAAGKSGLAGLGYKGKVALCRLNLRVIRAETGEIVIDQTMDGTARSTSIGFGAGGVSTATGAIVGGAVGRIAKHHVPLSDAMQACANKLAYYVATQLNEAPWQGTVASVSGDSVTVIGGTNVGLREGLTLTLLSKGEEIIDPESHESAGFETSEIGQVRIVTVAEKFSTCAIIQGAGVKQGDLVRREVVKK